MGSVPVPVPALPGGAEGKSQGELGELSGWAGLTAPQGWVPYICLSKALPKWITGTSSRYLNGKATMLCVHTKNSCSTCLQCKVAVPELRQAD